MTLQLLNLELETIEPWAAGGSMVATAECSQPLVSGAILRDDRARIVMPMWLAPGSQCVAPLAAANPLNLTLPGIPESSNIFELSAGRLQPLRHRREAGGTQVTLDEFGLSSLLFLAQDPTIIEAVSRRAAASGRQTAELERYLAAQKLDTVIRVLGQIGGRMPPQIESRAGLRHRPAELEIVRRPAGHGRLCHGLGLRAAGDDAAAEVGTGGVGNGHERPRFAGGHPRHVVLPGLALVLGPGRSDRGHASRREPSAGRRLRKHRA